MLILEYGKSAERAYSWRALWGLLAVLAIVFGVMFPVLRRLPRKIEPLYREHQCGTYGSSGSIVYRGHRLGHYERSTRLGRQARGYASEWAAPEPACWRALVMTSPQMGDYELAERTLYGDSRPVIFLHNVTGERMTRAVLILRYSPRGPLGLCADLVVRGTSGAERTLPCAVEYTDEPAHDGPSGVFRRLVQGEPWDILDISGATVGNDGRSLAFIVRMDDLMVRFQGVFVDSPSAAGPFTLSFSGAVVGGKGAKKSPATVATQ